MHVSVCRKFIMKNRQSIFPVMKIKMLPSVLILRTEEEQVCVCLCEDLLRQTEYLFLL